MNLFNLFGKITLDTSDYEKGIDDAKQKNAEFTQNTGTVTKSAAAGWAAVVAIILKVANTIKKLIVDSMEYADRIKNLAQIYGYTTQEIQEMMSVANQSGKDVEKVLRSIRTSGQTAAEYLGLSAEEYAEMVDTAYEFNTIIGEDSLNKVDALGDKIAYLKAEWQAAVTAVLAGEETSEEAIAKFFENAEKLIDEHGSDIARFAVKLVSAVAVALGDVLVDALADIIVVLVEETILNVNWVEIAAKISVALAQAFVRIIGDVIGKFIDYIGEKIGNTSLGAGYSSTWGRMVKEMQDSFDFADSVMWGDDYSVSENSRQTIDININVGGDTQIDQESAELVGDVVSQQIDEILGRKLNG